MQHVVTMIWYMWYGMWYDLIIWYMIKLIAFINVLSIMVFFAYKLKYLQYIKQASTFPWIGTVLLLSISLINFILSNQHSRTRIIKYIPKKGLVTTYLI